MTYEKIWVGKGRLFYFNDDVKLELFYIHKKIVPVDKLNNYILFIECTKLYWNRKDANGLCVYILFKNMGWHLVLIGKPHSYKLLIFISAGKFPNGTLNILNKSQYNCWYK